MQDTLENVSHELDCIFETGFYHYVFSSHGGKNNIQMYLEYQAASAVKKQAASAVKKPPASAVKKPPEVYQQESTSSGLSLDDVELDTECVPQQMETEIIKKLDTECVPQQMETEIMEKLGSEQITDLVRKLGFMESKKHEEQIQLFLQLNEVITPLE